MIKVGHALIVDVNPIGGRKWLSHASIKRDSRRILSVQYHYYPRRTLSKADVNRVARGFQVGDKLIAGLDFRFPNYALVKVATKPFNGPGRAIHSTIVVFAQYKAAGQLALRRLGGG